MHVYVIGHHTRRQRATTLAELVGGTLIMDEGNHGPAWGHRQALTTADRVLVLEDDAEPVPNFLHHVNEWVSRFPDDLLSFYLGSGYRSTRVTRHITEQWDNPQDHITHPDLIHAVCYTIPVCMAPAVRDHLDPNTPIDFAIGNAWRHLTNRPVIYPKASLVDHADIPSTTGTTRLTRKALRLA